ncbi:MAG: SDR family oxidoreductase [Bdellovibrionota bacterium]
MNKTIAVTGASGFVGAHLALGLARAGFEVAAFGGTKPAPAIVRKNGATCSNVDLSDSSAAREALTASQPSIVVHAAALANANTCEQEPGRAALHNVDVTRNVGRICADMDSELLIYVSTDLVFDGGSAPLGGFTEKSEPHPSSVYARTKFEAENIANNSKTPTVILRTALVYGREIEGLEGFMGWLRGGLSRGEARTLFSDEYRTPIFVGDITRVIASLARLAPYERQRLIADTDGRMILNLGGRERVSRLELGMRVAEVFGFDPKLIVPSTRDAVPSAAPRPSDVSLCVTKLKSTLGIEPLGVVDGLQRVKAHSDSE